MTEPIFRDATKADIPFILALSDGGAVEGTSRPKSDPDDPAVAKAFAAIGNDPNHRLVIVEEDGEITGTLQISFIPGLSRNGMWRGMLENVHVRSDRRGHGLGGKMMRWAIEVCRAQGCGMVQLTSNKARADAHRFYKNLGFEASHEGFKLMF